MALPLSYTVIKDFFGPNTAAVPIFGAEAALNDLTVAIELMGYSILHQVDAKFDGAFRLAYRPLQMAGQFPGDGGVETIVSLYGDEILAPGIDTSAGATETVHRSQPFRGLHLSKVLRFLKMAGIYHEQTSIDLGGATQRYAYQLGVVTMKMHITGPSFQAQLISAQQNVKPTHTIWLYCCVKGDEDWYAICPALTDINETLRPPMPAEALTTQTKQQSLRDEVQAAGESQLDNRIPAPRPPTRRRNKKPDVTGLSFDDILNGAAGDIGDHGELITGEVILHIAPYFSNTEIFEKINAVLEGRGRPTMRSPNNITRRITVAIQGLAARSETAVEKIRENLNLARHANGVNSRRRTHTRNRRAAAFSRRRMAPVARTHPRTSIPGQSHEAAPVQPPSDNAHHVLPLVNGDDLYREFNFSS